jgi:hypothetical protein
MGLKRNDKIAAFRVVARGPGCIPVLEARYRGHDGCSYGLEAFGRRNRGWMRARRVR